MQSSDENSTRRRVRPSALPTVYRPSVHSCRLLSGYCVGVRV